MQEGGSLVVKGRSKEALEPLKLEMQKNSTELNKPLITSKEPSNYGEITTKLNHLMEKVMELAWSTEEVSDKNSVETQNLTRTISSNNIKSVSSLVKNNNLDTLLQEKITNNLGDSGKFAKDLQTHKQYSSLSSFGLHMFPHTNPNAKDKDNIPKLAPPYASYRVDDKSGFLREPVVPPIMNDRIKYIKVSSKDFSKSESSEGLLKNDADSMTLKKQARSKINLEKSYKFQKSLSQENLSGILVLDSYIRPTENTNLSEEETFRILISGHLTTKETPVFIIHKNYIKTSTLVKDALDFRTHKKRGNVDILLTGKFFNDNILIENDKGQPSALDLKSHKLLIDRRSTVAQERLKHTFNLGLFDAILEGEFVANKETLQYIPIFSLEIGKHKKNVTASLDKATSAEQIDVEHAIDSSRDKTVKTTDKQVNTKMLHSSQEQSHIIYLTKSQENNLFDAQKSIKHTKMNKKTRESTFTKLKENLLLFLRNKGNRSNGPQNTESSRNTDGVRKTQKKEKSPRKTGENKQRKNLNPTEISSLENCDFNGNEGMISLQQFKKEENTMEKKCTKRKHSKRNKIAENPGLSQMQGFFF